MAAQQKQENTFTWDDPMVLMGILVGGYIIVWMAWTFGHTQISTAYVYLRYLQSLPVYLIGIYWPDAPGASLVTAWVLNTCQPEGVIGFCRRDFSTMSWDELSDSSMWVNIGWIAVLIVVCFRIFRAVDKKHPALNFARDHNINSFVRESKKLYPHLKLFGELDMIAEPLDHPLYGMSRTSRQFAFHHRLIAGWQKEEDGTVTPTLDRKRAAEVFRSQLGKLWTHERDLSPGETLLFAIVLPRAAATDARLDDAAFHAALDDSDRMIAWCWEQFVPPVKGKGDATWLRPEIDLSRANELIARYIKRPVIQAAFKQHAFNRTILVALFAQARRLGVLPPAEVRWMRFFDRELWYVVENMGRQAGYAEGAAALSHYLYEAKAGSGIPEPQVDKAINALDTAMTGFRFGDAEIQKYDGLAVSDAA